MEKRRARRSFQRLKSATIERGFITQIRSLVNFNAPFNECKQKFASAEKLPIVKPVNYAFIRSALFLFTNYVHVFSRN